MEEDAVSMSPMAVGHLEAVLTAAKLLLGIITQARHHCYYHCCYTSA